MKSQQSGNDLPWNPRLHYGLFPAVFSETEDGDANESAWPTRKDALHASASSLPTMSGVPWPVGEEANRMLDRFHRVLTCLSPFVVVPRDLSSDELLEKRPFLWKGIMVACAFVQGRRQRLLGEQFLEEITRTALVLGESSLDVLQGLLLFVSWYGAFPLTPS